MKENGTVVYVADHNTMMRNGLAMLVHRVKPGSKVVGFKDMAEIFRSPDKPAPNLIVYEASQSYELEICRVKELTAKFPATSIVVMRDPLNLVEENQLNELQIDGCFTKNAPIQRIEKLISKEIDGLNTPIRLTNSQRRILSLLETGCSGTRMAEALNLSVHTIKIHVYRLYKKLGVNNMVKAVHVGRTHGLLATAENFGIDETTQRA